MLLSKQLRNQSFSNSLFNEPLDDTWSKIQQLASAAETSSDFVNTLYTLAKSSTPKNPYNPTAYNDELNHSQDSLPQSCKLTYLDGPP